MVFNVSEGDVGPRIGSGAVLSNTCLYISHKLISCLTLS